MRIDDMKRILFICTHNASRSQMAEGILKSLYSDRYEVYSAGTEPTSIHPVRKVSILSDKRQSQFNNPTSSFSNGVNSYAIKVMAEIGIDISFHRAKSINEFRDMNFDYIVTVCDKAKETCPYFAGSGKKLHQSFDDPS